MGSTWELPTIEVGDTTFFVFGDAIANAEEVVYIQRLDNNNYLVKLNTNETIQAMPPMFEPDDTSDVEP
jgi:hypothetical protein